MTRDIAPAKLQALMRAAQTGDMRAYESVLRIITPKLRQLIRRQRPFFSAEEIEDLVQEIPLSVHAVRATYDPNRCVYRKPKPERSGGEARRELGVN